MQSPISASLKAVTLALLGLILGVAMCRTAAAQAGTAAAALNGTVRDASGAVVPGATVALTNTKTGFRQVTESNSTGNYTLVNISPGDYVASVSKDGFATEKSPNF